MASSSKKVLAQPKTEFQLFPQTGFVRLTSILAPAGPIPVGRSTWWAGVKDGRFPKPMKLGPRVTVWRAEDIWALLERGVL
ncbi:MAG TPA: AlpA family phage regulatory protein [Methylocella sp.]|nr:AlpA family phage regulatory protein [Methylocella sp.]